MSVVIGCDPHKRTHTAVAVDARTGEVLAEITVATTDHGHGELLRWATELSSVRRWAVEDCRHVSLGLQRALLGAGEDVVAVPPKLMALARRSERERGKSDAIDAKAVALALLREPGLPKATIDEDARELKILLSHREDLVTERTRVASRLRWHLHDLGLEADVPAGALDRRRWVLRIGRRLARCDQSAVVVVARTLLRRCEQLTQEAASLEATIAAMVRTRHPELLAIPGCGVLTAAKLAAELAGAGRFSSDAKLAMHAGVAPVPCSTGASNRVRLNRSGNRQLNLAFHRIAISQARVYEPARQYVARKQAEGMSRREAIRCLKRHLVRRVYNVMTRPRISEGLT